MKTVIRRVSVAIAVAATLMSVAIAPASAAPNLEPYKIPKPGAAAKAAAASDAVWTVIVPKTTDPEHGAPSTRCADIAWNSVDNGARAILFDCYGTNNQKWAPIWVNSDSQYGTAMFVNANSGKCLDLTNGSAEDGAHVVQWNCHNGSNQQWDVVLPPGADPQTHLWPVLFKNRATGKCLDLDFANTVNGTGFLQWECHGNANQQFTLRIPR